MSHYEEIVPQVIKMLGNLNNWLDEAVTHAESRGFEPDNYLTARLYPDMFPLTRQIQTACDNAKFIGARLSETEAPSDPDTETTIEELRARIAKTVAFLEGIDADAFEGGGERVLSPAMLRGGTITGTDYLREFAIPNFYFHMSMAYALLRKQGVQLGKRKYLGPINVKPPAS